MCTAPEIEQPLAGANDLRACAALADAAVLAMLVHFCYRMVGLPHDVGLCMMPAVFLTSAYSHRNAGTRTNYRRSAVLAAGYWP